MPPPSGWGGLGDSGNKTRQVELEAEGILWCWLHGQEWVSNLLSWERKGRENLGSDPDWSTVRN